MLGVILLPFDGDARVSLEALRHDGYGVVQIDRPEPNVLTVVAMINGRKAHLIVDTGWSLQGITVKADYGKSLHSPVQGVKSLGHSASGYAMAGFQQGTADTVMLGNVEMRNVPVFFGTLGSLQHSYTHRDTHADGYIGSGFLSTCSAIVDLHNLRLYLRPPGTGHRAVISQAMKAQGLAEAPFEIIKTDCVVRVEINGVPGIMCLDTGANLAGVDERFVPKMNARSYSSRVRSMDASGAEGATKLTRLSSFRIAGVNVRAPDLRTSKFGLYDETKGQVVGLLGMDILGKNGAIIDFGQKKIYLYPL
jgi:predicted aspartyl protease